MVEVSPEIGRGEGERGVGKALQDFRRLLIGKNKKEKRKPDEVAKESLTGNTTGNEKTFEKSINSGV